MLRYISIALLVLSMSCKSDDGPHTPAASYPEIQFIPKDTDSSREAAAAVPGAAPAIAPLVLVHPSPTGKDCDPKDAPACANEEPDNYTRIVLVEYDKQLLPDHEQIVAFGESPCKARQALYKAVCAAGLNFARSTNITLHPDPNKGACPTIQKDCDQKKEPTRCFADSYDEQDLSWTSRPEVWGSNECDARNKLAQRACNTGLDPNNLKSVRCEAEKSTVLCPPIWKNCVPQENELTECKLAKVGEINLKQPIKAIGKNRCEAKYMVQELACRMQKAPLTDLAGVECQGVDKPYSVTKDAVVSPPASNVRAN